MAELKTKLTGESVKSFLDAIPDEQVRNDCREVARVMEAATKSKPRMWGKIVGFGTSTIRYADGREADWMLIGFAPRAKTIALYIGSGGGAYDELKDRLGKHSGGGTSCLHIRKLSDVHAPTLKKLVQASVAHLKLQGSKRSARPEKDSGRRER
jgi:hypothetical protein